jgi:cell division septation protein DedD
LAAVELAELVADHRPRTLLVNTVVGSDGPDRVLGADDRPGLGEVVAGLGRMRDAAATPRGRSFLFIPAGTSSPGIDQLCAAPAFRHLVGAAGRGGTLLLHVAAEDLARLFHEAAAGEGLEFDGLVLLGDASVPPDVPPGVQVLARAQTEAPSPVPSPVGHKSGFTRPSGTPAIVAGGRAPTKARTRVERLIEDIRKRGTAGARAVAAVWLVAVISVWLIWQGLSGWPAFEDGFNSSDESSISARVPAETGIDPDASNAEGSPTADSELVSGEAADGESANPVAALGADSDGGPASPAESAVPPGVDLPYSVLVASYVTYEDAAVKRDQLVAAGHLAFVAPTPIRGRLYYRVFAGALEDRVQASDLMRRLVEGGDKERVRDWDMRPVRLALALRDFSSAQEADVERQRLHDSGVPAYVLSVGDTIEAIYRLYAGAFETEGAAGPADTLLSDAGLNATLVTRRGEPR